MSKKKNSSQTKSSQSQVDSVEAWVDEYDDDDLRYTLQEFNTNRQGFYCFSSDDFED